MGARAMPLWLYRIQWLTLTSSNNSSTRTQLSLNIEKVYITCSKWGKYCSWLRDYYFTWDWRFIRFLFLWWLWIEKWFNSTTFSIFRELFHFQTAKFRFWNDILTIVLAYFLDYFTDKQDNSSYNRLLAHQLVYYTLIYFIDVTD